MKKSAIGLLAAVMAGPCAVAADPDQAALSMLEAPELIIREPSGWYLRGDAGYAFNSLRGANSFQDSAGNSTGFDVARMADSFSLGAGIGYQINDLLRTDLTFDYMLKSDFRGAASSTCGDASASQPLVSCTSRGESSVTAHMLMANAYIDLGTLGYVTPYVGGGAGSARVNWKSLTATICNDPYNPGCNSTNEAGRTSWRFAYSLMAGVAVDLSCNLKADIGYRYRRIEGGEMFGGSASRQGRDKGIRSHEARVGIRYLFNGCDSASLMAPSEIPVGPLLQRGP